MSDVEPEAGELRVFDRLLTAGISLERAEMHLRAGAITCDGVVVTDRDAPATRPSRIVIVAP